MKKLFTLLFALFMCVVMLSACKYQSRDDIRADITNASNSINGIVLQSCDSNFSEGLCWMKIKYTATGELKQAIVDKTGNIVAEFDADAFSALGDFYNGVSLVTTGNGVHQYVNSLGEVVFSSDDTEYSDLIQGVYDGGYIFIKKTEASLTSSATYYAVINHNKEFVIDWTEYGDYDLFNYYGGGVFVFLEDYETRKDVSGFWYNAETDTWGDYNYIWARSFLTQPNLVAEEADGWLTIEGDNSELIAISTKDGTVYDLDSYWTYVKNGIYGDNAYVLVAFDYNDNVSKLAYFDTNTCSIIPINYEYTNLIEYPEDLFFVVKDSTYIEVGYWPAVNVFDTTSPDLLSTITRTVRTQSHLCGLQFSEGAMLLQLCGKDGIDYYTLIDKQGNNIIEPTPGEAIGTIGNGRFVVRVDGVCHIFNEKGEEIFTNLIAENSEYSEIYSIDKFHDGLAQCVIGDKSGCVNTIFVDIDGNVVFELGKTILEKTQKPAS